MGSVDAVYIFDEHNNLIVQHIYTGRPAAASTLLHQYLAQPAPRPPLIYLPSTSPATLLFSCIHDRILFLCPTASEIEPLLVLEFLRRLVDALEAFLGAPLLAAKMLAECDVVVQILSDMCDAGVVCNTEPNALRETVEVSSWMGSLFGGLGLPASSPALGARGQASPLASLSLSSNDAGSSASAGPAIPWRRANVRHTSNELYVDIVESLSVILAPSGRPISAFAHGSIAFNSKISGVPDLLLVLSAPGGKVGILNAMDLPCFHPCVRLARWREHPGELSFIPPDGRFVLAGYECNLLPDMFGPESTEKDLQAASNINLPATVEVDTCLGANGDELEVRLLIHPRTTSASSTSNTSSSATGAGRGFGNTGSFRPSSPAFRTNSSPSGTPPIENMVVSVPVSPTVRNVTDLRAGKGEAHYTPSEEVIEWRLSNREVAAVGKLGVTMRCTLVGQLEHDGNGQPDESGLQRGRYDYDEDVGNQQDPTNGGRDKDTPAAGAQDVEDDRRRRRFASLMPRSASLSFSIRGWLASGVRVESLTVNTKTSKGLGAGVTPYKGVKYVTVSQNGVETRC